jgi:crotonobetainyl-CoA:carnitine CoA-transferase CaiB-like acyl-CoA transferase
VSAPLDGIRVLELTDETADYGGRLLAGLGADVVKAEPPGGSPGRAIGPFLEDASLHDPSADDPSAGDAKDAGDRSLAFWADNVGKRSVVVHDDDEVLELCGGADVLIHTLRAPEAVERGLSFAALSARFPDLIVAAVTPFGQDGPWADYLADDLVLMALGGSMAGCGYGPGADGTYDTPPLAALGDQAWRTASTYAAIAVLAALAWRGDARASEPGKPNTHTGQFIDVSAHECSASMTEWHLMSYLCSGQSYRRGPHPSLTAADGRQVAALTPDFLGPHVFTKMLEMLEAEGVAGALSDPAFADPRHRAQNYGEVWRALKRLAETHSGEELYRLGQSAGLPWGVVRSPDEVLDDAHLAARRHFVELEHPELGRTVPYPGAPFVASGSPWVMTRRPPLLGEHSAEVRAEWAARP